MKRYAVVLLCIMFILSGCSGGGDEASVNQNFGGKISLFAYTPDTLNPLLTGYAQNTAALSVMYDSVMELNSNLETGYNLAENHRFSEDGKSCTFRLRQGVKFSDGTTVTAANIISSMDMIKENTKSIYYRLFEFVDSYSADGDYAFTVKLKKPGASFLSYMNFPVVKSEDELIGSGEYKLVQKNDEKLILTAVSESVTNIQTIDIIFYPAEEMRVNSFLTNETDVISSDFYTLAQLTAKPDTSITEYVSDYYTFLGFNHEKDLFKDLNFKKSVSSLIDKNAVVESVLVGHGVKTNSPYKPETIYHRLFDGEYAYDKELSAQYLEKCELEEVPSFNILVNKESPAKVKTAEFISQALKDGGINVSVQQVSYDTYLSRIENGEYDAFIGEYTMASDFELDFMFGEGNVLKYENESLKGMMAQFASAQTADAKKRAAEKIQREVVANLPVISLYYRTNMVVADKSIKGKIQPLPNNIYSNLPSWYLK